MSRHSCKGHASPEHKIQASQGPVFLASGTGSVRYRSTPSMWTPDFFLVVSSQRDDNGRIRRDQLSCVADDAAPHLPTRW